MSTRVVLFLVASLLLAGCGSQPNARSGTVTLRIWYSTDDPVERIWSQQLARGFEATHRGIQVRLTPYSFEDLNTKLQLALSAGASVQLMAKDGDMATLREAADARGHQNLGIWQTEVGFTTDPGYIANDYPRFLYWALTNHWDHADKYKLFYFADWAPGDPASKWNYQHCLWSGAALNFHGVVLQNLAALLEGPELAAFPGVTSTPSLMPSCRVTFLVSAMATGMPLMRKTTSARLRSTGPRCHHSSVT